MGQPAAKQGDRITGKDTHVEIVPTAAGVTVLTSVPHDFDGIINGNLSSNVNIMGQPAATQDSTADNIPPHIPRSGPFETRPANRAQIITGSNTVLINGKLAARNGDTALTCNDPVDLPNGTVVAQGTVLIG